MANESKAQARKNLIVSALIGAIATVIPFFV